MKTRDTTESNMELEFTAGAYINWCRGFGRRSDKTVKLRMIIPHSPELCSQVYALEKFPHMSTRFVQ